MPSSTYKSLRATATLLAVVPLGVAIRTQAAPSSTSDYPPIRSTAMFFVNKKMLLCGYSNGKGGEDRESVDIRVTDAIPRTSVVHCPKDGNRSAFWLSYDEPDEEVFFTFLPRRLKATITFPDRDEVDPFTKLNASIFHPHQSALDSAAGRPAASGRRCLYPSEFPEVGEACSAVMRVMAAKYTFAQLCGSYRYLLTGLFPHMRDSEMTVAHSHLDGPISLSPGGRLDRVLYLLEEMM
ncbi:hypothetical protein FOZ62_017468 [Perkinsus olseni]|uniref:Uncharacterized protein n=1 Tax=Perkinsus olseni TaxID=32597 RepID=A0A7J6QK94_PEROL|nr:hypothetical protein FOZ62_017468 [Perkinsus olseni]